MALTKCLLPTFIAVLFSTIALAQDQDSLKKKNDVFIPRKNVIRYNLTPNILGFKAFVLGYERVTRPYQSFSINAGFLAFQPSKKSLMREDSLNSIYGLDQTRDNKGFSVFADYRFYLKKENKYPAQRGIYVGPYAGAYYLESTNVLSATDDAGKTSSAGLATNLLIYNIGAELGYQFVIKNRITIDLILAGPSISRYRLRMKGVGQLTVNDPEFREFIGALRDILVDQNSWLAPLFDGEEVEVTGTTSTWSLGMRYVLQVGFRF